MSENTTIRRISMSSKSSSKGELVDIPLLRDDESGDSGIVDGKVELECNVEAVYNSTPTTPISLTPPNETRLAIVLQVSVPFLFAGLGCVLAGLLLDVVEVSKCWCMIVAF